jgi:4-hydroxy-tetrahydrodipicolinate reductase
MTNIAVLGVSGRMGRCLIRSIRESADLSVSGALASAQSPALGRDAGDVAGSGPIGVTVTADRAEALAGADVVIDFTLPDAAIANLEAAAALGIPVVIGTTGLDEATQAAIRRLSHDLPVLVAPNMSLGVNLLFSLVDRAAAALGEDYDIEIFEAHHRNKVDAPSGTALRIAEIAAGARGRMLADIGIHTRAGQIGPRPRGGIGFAVMRGGDIVGEHRVTYAGIGESLEIAHRASDRMTFAYGAVTAARWIAGRPPGLYGMADVLGL